MKYHAFAVAALAALLLALGASLMSCKEAEQETAANAPSAGAPPPSTAGDSAPADAADQTTPPATQDDSGAASEAPPATSDYVSGKDVYKSANCEMCHGKELQGSRLAPPLSKLSVNWDKEKLAAYLVDPEGYTENDPRLKASAGQYSLPMPAWKQTGLAEADMQLLIDWLLEQD